MGDWQDAGSATCGSGGSGTERLIVRLGGHRRFGRGFGTCGDHDSVRGGTGIGFFLDANQILIRDFPAEMFVLAALFEILLEEDGAAGIGDEDARRGQKDVPDAILHLHATP